MGWMRWMSVLSLGSDALMLASAIDSKSPEQFGMSLHALLHDVASAAKIKEIDESFLASIQPEIQALTAKIFAKIGT